MKVRIQLDGNKIVLVFENYEEARFFYSFLKTFKHVELGTGNPGLIQITEDELDKYREFLRRKPDRPVKDRRTLQEQLSYIRKFIKCSNGEVTPETILNCIKNKHYATALRNYLHMKRYYDEIDDYTYKKLLEKIPKFKEETRLARDRVPVSQILVSIAKASKTKYKYIYYALLYTGGTRLEQLLNSLYNKYRLVDNDIIRLEITGKGTKTALYAWMPLNLYLQLINMKITAKPRSIARYFTLNELTSVTLLRSFSWQTAKQLLGETLALLLQGRIGELSKRVTARHYDDLTFQLDTQYNVWKQFVDDLIANATEDIEQAKKRAKKLIAKYNLIMPI